MLRSDVRIGTKFKDPEFPAFGVGEIFNVGETYFDASFTSPSGTHTWAYLYEFLHELEVVSDT